MPFTEWFGQALKGPGHLRFIIQPAIAVLLALRDGHRDFREHREPFVWGLLHRRAKLTTALRKIAVPLSIAIVIEAILEFYTLRSIRPSWAILVGIFLVGLPYIVVRALSNRMFHAWAARHPTNPPTHAPQQPI
jgi:hypothetical protein